MVTAKRSNTRFAVAAFGGTGMHRITKAPLFIVSAALLAASGPSWTGKPAQQWNEEDAREILTISPWVKKVTPAQLPNVSEAARRQSGRMGGGQGVGLNALSASVFTGGGSPAQSRKRRRGIGPVEVRWESALPVRLAEKAVHEEDPPAWEGQMYAIAVYDVPGLDADQKGLASELKHGALLKPDGKKELRPVQVDLLPQEGDLMTVVYLFPRTMDITLEDQRVEFWAKFGRLSVAQYFYPREMQLQGKLEL
jgi:hypothetical protein